MRTILKKRTHGQIEFGIIYGGIALLAVCAGRFLPVLSFVPACVFKDLTGVPCPTCGATRSVVHLAHGDLTTSLNLNPLVPLCLIVAAIAFFYGLITLVFSIPRVRVILSDREKNIARSGMVALVLANWCYLIFSQ